ncbi:MAG: ABC transporter permease [Vallitaleaceae bacterium]|nr:ABC transporter permease [Vallitaleaceae bacterium]
MNNIKKIKIPGEFYLSIFTFIGFILLFFFTKFGTAAGINSFLKDVSFLLIAAIALYLVILTGNIDISAGTMMGLCGYMAAFTAKAGMPIYVFVPIAIVTGILLAGFNGILVTKFNVPSLVATLAMVNVHLGLFILLPQGGWVEGLETNFTALGSFSFFGFFPLVFIVASFVFAIFMWIVRNHQFGKKLFAVGGNGNAAILAGISPKKVVMKVFLLEGALIGIASILFYTPKSVVQANATYGMEMLFISSVVVGGTRISGGKGKIVGTAIGVVLISLINRAMIFMGLQDYYSYAAQGIIILVAVLISGTDMDKIKVFFRRSAA